MNLLLLLLILISIYIGLYIYNRYYNYSIQDANNVEIKKTNTEQINIIDEIDKRIDDKINEKININIDKKIDDKINEKIDKKKVEERNNINDNICKPGDKLINKYINLNKNNQQDIIQTPQTNHNNPQTNYNYIDNLISDAGLDIKIPESDNPNCIGSKNNIQNNLNKKSKFSNKNLIDWYLIANLECDNKDNFDLVNYDDNDNGVGDYNSDDNDNDDNNLVNTITNSQKIKKNVNFADSINLVDSITDINQ